VPDFEGCARLVCARLCVHKFFVYNLFFEVPVDFRKGLSMKKNRIDGGKGALRYYRKVLQLSLSELAQLFGISKSYCHLMEKRQRPVPTHLLLDLVAYVQSMQATAESPASLQQLLQTEQAHRTGFLLETRAKLHYRLLGLERELARLQGNRQQLLQKLQGIAAILATGRCGLRATNFLRMADRDCQHQLRLYSPRLLVHLQLKMEGIQRQLEVVEKLLETDQG